MEHELYRTGNVAANGLLQKCEATWAFQLDEHLQYTPPSDGQDKSRAKLAKLRDSPVRRGFSRGDVPNVH